jgi:serine phosphatase RsbU (regulator of sigma subunit)
MKINWTAHAVNPLTLGPDQSLETVHRAMIDHNADFAAVLGPDLTVKGLVSFQNVTQILSAKFGQALFARKPISQVGLDLKVNLPQGGTKLQHVPAITPRNLMMLVGPDHDFFAAQELFGARDDQHYFDDIVVLDKAGHYAGLLSVREFDRLQYMVLFNQKQEIEAKNLQIVDSINYALRIQQAMLCDEEAEAAPMRCEKCVYFLPRDIVSGDFYWFHQEGDWLFIAAVDCTGHGVPGAFMSLIGHSLLEEIVVGRAVRNPGAILAEMNRKLRRTLRQDADHGTTSDGMDVALCIVNFAASQLEFAGAKRPLFYIDGNGELAEIKGSRRSIGGRQKEKERVFPTHKLPLREAATCYLTTDGFADQPDATGRKYGTPRLRQLLQKCGGLSLPAQLDLMTREMRSHQGTEPQRDDMTLIAFRPI